MHAPSATILKGQTVKDAVDAMSAAKSPYLPVLDEKGRLVGLVTRASLVDVLAEVIWKAE